MGLPPQLFAGPSGVAIGSGGIAHDAALPRSHGVGHLITSRCAGRVVLELHAQVHRLPAARALRLLLATMKAHPDLRAVMVAEGWEFPTPLRRQRARAKATA